ncbi:ATP-binding cassette domain-containing protein [Nonomuraea sp. NPDC005692]|uniref:ABC transporter ATP-binding protein n=1 Tax=Nonomuraea sp. NPDC005692 TaxID=3157168 RepID=UPI0033ECBA64
MVAWEAGRWYVLLQAVLTAATGIAPVLTAWCTKLVLDEVAGRATTMAGLAPYVAALLVLAAVAGTGPYVTGFAEAEFERRVGLLVRDRLYTAVNALPGLARLEDPAFQDRLHLAERAGSSGPGRVVTSALGLAQAGIMTAGFLVTLVGVSPAVAVLVAVAALPLLRVHLRLGREQAKVMRSTGHGQRREMFFARLLSMPHAAKEIRLFGLGDFFRERMLTELRAVDAERRRMAVRQLRGQSGQALLAAAIWGAGLVWIVAEAVAGRASVGDLSVFVAAVAGTQGGLAAGVRNLAAAHEALLLFGHYRAVLNTVPDLTPPTGAPRGLTRQRQRPTSREREREGEGEGEPEQGITVRERKQGVRVGLRERGVTVPKPEPKPGPKRGPERSDTAPERDITGRERGETVPEPEPKRGPERSDTGRERGDVVPEFELERGVVVRGVWFRYGADQPWVLRGVDLDIPAGRSLALVGLNGAGKSTLVKLLCRFYDPERGAIFWDGVDLRELDPAALRERLGAVFQDFAAYDLSAAENIAVGDLRAGRGRVEAAAVRAGADAMVRALPRGYDTLLTRMFSDDEQSGVTLSGGQWQRIALARGLLRDRPELMILDEPNAGLDPAAEHEVHTVLREHRAGRTTLLISHRLSTVRDADTIAVLADGQVVERGTHEELLRAGGRYAELFATQARGYAPAGVR